MYLMWVVWLLFWIVLWFVFMFVCLLWWWLKSLWLCFLMILDCWCVLWNLFRVLVVGWLWFVWFLKVLMCFGFWLGFMLLMFLCCCFLYRLLVGLWGFVDWVKLWVFLCCWCLICCSWLVCWRCSVIMCWVDCIVNWFMIFLMVILLLGCKLSGVVWSGVLLCWGLMWNLIRLFLMVFCLVLLF